MLIFFNFNSVTIHSNCINNREQSFNNESVNLCFFLHFNLTFLGKPCNKTEF